MCVCHVAADELGAIFLFIVNKQSCSPPFVLRDRETLKSRNPSALNLPNDETGGRGKKKNESILRCTRVLRANPLLCIDNVCAHVCACMLCVCVCECVCALFARSCLQFPRAVVCVRIHKRTRCTRCLSMDTRTCTGCLYRVSFQSRIL